MTRPAPSRVGAGLITGALLLVACEQGTDCTDAGGYSGVSVRLDAGFVRDKAPARITVCRETACETRRLSFVDADPAAGYVDTWIGLDALPPKRVGLQVRIRDTADVVLVEDGVTVQGEASYPNGRGCSPKVAVAAFAVGGDGSLSPRTASYLTMVNDHGDTMPHGAGSSGERVQGEVPGPPR